MRVKTVYGKLQKLEESAFGKIVLNCRVFVYTYFVVCLLLSFPVIAPYMNIPSKLCFLWAVGLIGWDVFFTHRVFRMPYWVFPLLFLGVYGISVLLNAGYVLSNGCKHLVHCAIFMVLIYEVLADASGEEILKMVKNMFKILIAIIFVASLISVVLFTMGVAAMVNGYKVGFWENRLYGVYPSPNPGALFALLSVIGSVLLICFNKKRSAVSVIGYALNILVQFIYFSLTLSKAGTLAMITFIVAFGLFWGMGWFCRRCKVIIAVPATIISIALVILLFMSGITGIRQMMVKLPGLVYGWQSKASVYVENGKNKDEEATVSADGMEDVETEENIKAPIQEIVLERTETGGDISNNRFAIWLGALKVADQDLLFGMADMSTNNDTLLARYDYSGLNAKEKYEFVRVNGYLHNVYVQILTYAGVLGLLAFLAFAAFVVVRLLRTLCLGNPDSWMYTLLAVMLGLSAMLVVNGIAESHLLFNRQDPIGFLFWFFLGVAMSLERTYRQSLDYFREKPSEEFAFVAATPLQVLHCTEFVGNNLEGSAGCADLYVVHTFGTADKVSEGAKKSGIFNNVYDLQPRIHKNKVVSKLATFYDLFFPKQALNKKSCGERLELEKKHYKYVCASSQTTFTIGVRLLHPQAKVYLYDDGIGSYFGSMVHDYNSKLFEVMNKIFFRGMLILEPDVMYLAVPELCDSTHQCPRRKIAALSEEKMCLLEDIFDYRKNTIYQDCRIVYLTQPFEGFTGISVQVEPEVIRILETYAQDAVARVHPRQKNAQFGCLARDTVENLWELECLKQISERNILISYCSTAQFMPKLLKGTEPYVIFLYKIFGNKLGDAQAKLVENFVGMHSDPERVYIPDSLDELKQILEKLL